MRRAHQLSLSPTQTCLFTSERCLKVRVEQPQASPVRRRPSISRPQSSLEMLQKRNRSTTRRLCSSNSHLKTIFTFRALRENWASRAGRSPSNRRARYPDWAATAVPALISRDIRGSPTSKADCEISAEKRTPIRLCVLVPKPGRDGQARGQIWANRAGRAHPLLPGPPARHISGKARKG